MTDKHLFQLGGKLENHLLLCWEYVHNFNNLHICCSRGDVSQQGRQNLVLGCICTDENINVIKLSVDDFFLTQHQLSDECRLPTSTRSHNNTCEGVFPPGIKCFHSQGKLSAIPLYRMFPLSTRLLSDLLICKWRDWFTMCQLFQTIHE